MQIKSLGYRTDFIFNRFDGAIDEKEDYWVVKSSHNPNYFWGNLLLYKKPPQCDDLAKWQRDFKKELDDRRIYHMTFAWDTTDGNVGDPSAFVADGFELDTSVVLTTDRVVQPRKFNDAVEMRIIKTDEDFEQVLQIQIKTGIQDLSKAAREEFYRKQMKQYKRMITAGLGFWFGAFLNETLIGSLGVFTDAEIARYQIVSTDPSYQRQGVCSTLVFRSAGYVFEHLKCKTLVMVADEDYHAAKIYESVGFRPTQKQVGLCWWDKNSVTD